MRLCSIRDGSGIHRKQAGLQVSSAIASERSGSRRFSEAYYRNSVRSNDKLGNTLQQVSDQRCPTELVFVGFNSPITTQWSKVNLSKHNDIGYLVFFMLRKLFNLRLKNVISLKAWPTVESILRGLKTSKRLTGSRVFFFFVINLFLQRSQFKE